MLPFPTQATSSLRRLLKTLRTEQPVQLPELVSVPCSRTGTQVPHIDIDTRDLNLEEYLVQLNHTLCESYIEGHLNGAARIVLHNACEPLAPRRACRYRRVQRDPRDETTLRLFGCVEVQPTAEGS